MTIIKRSAYLLENNYAKDTKLSEMLNKFEHNPGIGEILRYEGERDEQGVIVDSIECSFSLNSNGDDVMTLIVNVSENFLQ